MCCIRAKNIKNQAVVNEDADQRTLLRKYERELRKLRAELTRRNKELVDKRHLLEVGDWNRSGRLILGIKSLYDNGLVERHHHGVYDSWATALPADMSKTACFASLQVEEQKRRAEADKLAALTALETASAEFMREKQEKKELEAKIQAMQVRYCYLRSMHGLMWLSSDNGSAQVAYQLPCVSAGHVDLVITTVRRLLVQSQLLIGGNKLEDIPAFRTLLAKVS